jgi:hypothetical protein
VQTPGNNYVLYTNDLNVSYFIGVDASQNYPRMFLAGDHNLGSGNPPTTAYQSGMANMSFDVSLGTNFPSGNTTGTGWMNNMHSLQGNVCMADASVEFFSRSNLQGALKNTGDGGGHTVPNFPVASGCSPAGMNRIQLP